MKLTKGMKKALSLLLTGALVIGGANVGTVSAEAAETLAWNGTLEMGIGWGWSGDASNGITPSETAEGSTLALTGLEWNDVGVGLAVESIADFTEPYVTVVATETTDGDPHEFAVTDSAWGVTYAGVNGVDNPETEELEDEVAGDVTVITGALDKAVTSYNVTAQGRTITAVYVHENGVDPIPAETEAPATEEPAATSSGSAVETEAPATEAPATEAPATEAPATEAPTATVAPTLIPESARTTAEKFDIKFQLTHADWSSLISDPVSITGNGDYTLTATVPEGVEAEDIMMLWLDAPELGYDNDKNIVITSGDFKVNDTVYKADANWWYRDCDGLEEAGSEGLVQKADGSGKTNSRRMNYRNQYNNWFNEKGEQVAEKSPVDAFAGTEIPYKAGDKISINITVSGMAEKSGATTAPTSGSITATAASIASPATAKITAAKKVVVAAGKTKNVKFTAEIDAPATSAAVVTATVKGNKKVTAKVVDGKVQIKAAKKAVKGSTAKVTLTSTNASGASVKATINVSVQNKAKKIKAPKKVTIKKGKTAKVVIKVKKAENKKKAITDTPKVTIKKVAKYVKGKTQIKKGKVVITLKGKKKGSAKMTVKIGKAKAKVNVKVK